MHIAHPATAAVCFSFLNAIVYGFNDDLMVKLRASPMFLRMKYYCCFCCPSFKQRNTGVIIPDQTIQNSEFYRSFMSEYDEVRLTTCELASTDDDGD